MRTLFTTLIAFLLMAGLTGCASDGSFKNPFASSEPPKTGTYYFSEFPDIPIPNELSEQKSDTFVTFAPSGLKCGVQRFTGRVELVSLMNTLRRNMSSNGWTLRSLLRSKESVLVFEKPDRVAAMQITDGLVFTELRIFVSSRLDGDTGAVDISAFPATPSQPAAAQ